MEDLIRFVLSSPLALAVIIIGLAGLGFYADYRRRREHREDIRRAIEASRR